MLFGGNLGVAGYLDWSVSQPQTYLYALIGLGVVGRHRPGHVAKVRQPLRFTVLGAIGVAGAALVRRATSSRVLTPDVREEFRVRRSPTSSPSCPSSCCSACGALAIARAASPASPRRCSSPSAPGLHGPRSAPRAGVLAPDRQARPARHPVRARPVQLRAAGRRCSPASAALVFWGPKLWGRRLPGPAAAALAVLGLLAVVLVAFPDLVLGFLDQPLGEVNFQLDQENLGEVPERRQLRRLRPPAVRHASPSRPWRCATSAARARRSTTTRGTARRSSGPPRRPRRPTRTSPSGSVRSTSPEPLLDRKAAAPARRCGLMLALPPAPSPARPRTLLVGHRARVRRRARCCSPACSAVYLALRDAAGGTTTDWLPKGVEIPDVAVNMMLVTMLGGCVIAQWAVYAIARDNRRDTTIALGVLAAVRRGRRQRPGLRVQHDGPRHPGRGLQHARLRHHRHVPGGAASSASSSPC